MISGKLRIEVQTVELMPLLQGAIEIQRPGAEAKLIRIQSFLNPGIGFIKGDPTRLQQVFHSLLSNAVKFTPRGGTIKVRLGRCNSDAEVSVMILVRVLRLNFFPMFLTDSVRRIVQERDLIVVSAWGLPSSNISLNFTGETLTPQAPVKARVRRSASIFPSPSFSRILSEGRGSTQRR
jgi:hypothetical protein